MNNLSEISGVYESYAGLVICCLLIPHTYLPAYVELIHKITHNELYSNNESPFRSTHDNTYITKPGYS